MLLTFQTESNDESCYRVACYRLVTLLAFLLLHYLLLHYRQISGPIIGAYSVTLSQSILLHYQLVVTLSVNMELHYQLVLHNWALLHYRA